MKAFKSLKAAAIVTLGLAVGGIALDQVFDLAHSCDIWWDDPNNQALDANSSGFFGNEGGAKELTTSYVKYALEPARYMNVAYTSGLSDNIDACAVEPGIFYCDQTMACPSDMYGFLDNPGSDGVVVISAWAGSQYQCSGTHYRDIIHHD